MEERKHYEVEVWGIALDPFNQSPIVVLRNKENPKELLPIWIGHNEASGIMMVLNDIDFSRPLTYELIKNMLRSLGATVERVEIRDIKDGTFFASLFLKDALGNIVEVDSRPSDAINIALRTNAPIFVAKHVMDTSKVNLDETIAQLLEEKENKENPPEEKIQSQDQKEEESAEIDQDLKAWLENLKPEDFEKYGKSKGGN
ncbi:MAG: bifunctional nuclease family protein [Aquificae bacterium]|jgi:bifunctional DNase/RNase|nr:bifunctional nuclease family protein [Aquificota bacterium]